MPRLREPRCFPYFPAIIETAPRLQPHAVFLPPHHRQDQSSLSTRQLLLLLGFKPYTGTWVAEPRLFSHCPGGLSVQEDIHAGNDWKTMLAHSQKKKCSTGDGSPERHGKAMKMASSFNVLGVWNSACFASWPWDQDKPHVHKGCWGGDCKKAGDQ